MSEDLFASTPAASSGYDASSIEVLEGLEPVRRRPGMYIGPVVSKEQSVFVFDDSITPRIIYKNATINEGLLRIFIEVLSNSIDNPLQLSFLANSKVEDELTPSLAPIST